MKQMIYYKKFNIIYKEISVTEELDKTYDELRKEMISKSNEIESSTHSCKSLEELKEMHERARVFKVILKDMLNEYL